MKKQKRNPVSAKLSSYFLIGIMAFLTEYISFLLLITTFSKLFIAQTISFMFGLMVSFFGNRNITFMKKEKYALSGNSQVVRYAVLAVCNLLLTNVLIYLLVDKAGVDPAVAKVFVMGSVVTWNYLIFSKVIFRTK